MPGVVIKASVVAIIAKVRHCSNTIAVEISSARASYRLLYPLANKPASALAVEFYC